MEQKHFGTRRRNGGVFAGVILASLLLAGGNIWAHTQVVNFGGSLGLVFSPSSFSAHVGDTVTWVGDFSMHTTTSTSVPVGAATWNFGLVSATTFSYVIHVAGTYDYQCNVHVSLGMVGSFTVSPSAVIYSAQNLDAERTTLITGTPSGKSYVRLTIPDTRRVSVSIADLRGRTLATVVDRTLSAGTYTEPLDGAIKTKGIYFVNIQGIGNEGREVFRFVY